MGGAVRDVLPEVGAMLAPQEASQAARTGMFSPNRKKISDDVHGSGGASTAPRRQAPTLQGDH